jgi:hypothetical protein
VFEKLPTEVRFPNVAACPVASIGPVEVKPAVAVNNPVTLATPEIEILEPTIFEVAIDPDVIVPAFVSVPELIRFPVFEIFELVILEVAMDPVVIEPAFENNPEL